MPLACFFAPEGFPCLKTYDSFHSCFLMISRMDAHLS